MTASMLNLNAISYSFDEVTDMFALSKDELSMRILHYNAGISSFAATLHFRDGFVIAADPLYSESTQALTQQILKGQKALKQEIQDHPERFALKQDIAVWLTAHEGRNVLFLEDFEAGKAQKRYIAASLPRLPFEDEAFDLVLVAHHFFTKAMDLSAMIVDLTELMRVANEVRIFPLLSSDGALTQRVGEVAAYLQGQGLGVEIKSSLFELQKYGNALMRIYNPACSVKKHLKHQG